MQNPAPGLTSQDPNSTGSRNKAVAGLEKLNFPCKVLTVTHRKAKAFAAGFCSTTNQSKQAPVLISLSTLQMQFH